MREKVVPFPARSDPRKAAASAQQRIVCQIGSQRFAIDYRITDLAAETSAVIVIRKKRQQRNSEETAQNR